MEVAEDKAAAAVESAAPSGGGKNNIILIALDRKRSDQRPLSINRTDTIDGGIEFGEAAKGF